MKIFIRHAVLLALASACVLPLAAEDSDTGLGRHKKLYAVPLTGAVTVDGKLDEWDLSGQVEMYVVSGTKEMQSAKLALMYDAEALYIGAAVRDPTPMMNRHDPKVSGDFGWDADACQFRIVVDPAQGYPVNQAGWDNPPVVNPQMAHLTLWNYSDTQEAVMAMQVGMKYAMPRQEWAPFGIVPSTLFQGKYLKAADGRGYTFEYRIPWSTLNAKAPPKAGDLVAGTVQFNWGQADGLKTAGGSAWCYDVMAGPGFPYQSSACWGKILFSATGKLAKEQVEEGLPPERPLPLAFTYQVPEDSEITVAISDAQGAVVRSLVAQGKRRAGENVERWDGFGSDGKPLAAGTYTWKGVYHEPITTKYVMSVHNSGQPGYQTDEPSSGWGADHGTPTTVCAAGDSMLLAWSVCELGWAIIKTDLNGKKIWGSKSSAKYLAVDGDHFYVGGCEGFDAFRGIKSFSMKDGRPDNFEGGLREINAPPGGDEKSDSVGGLAAHAGVIHAAYTARNLIARFDAKTGKLLGTSAVPAPGAIAVHADGSLAVISGGKVLLLKDGAVKPLIASHLDDPRSLAIAADGSICVANGGALQNVSVFGADGAYQRSIGKAGGRPQVGRYDRSGMLEPGGIAISSDGKLWAAETWDSPKRHSVWDLKTGACANEFFGSAGYFGWIHMDPEHPDEAYCHSVLWKIDLDKGTWEPKSTIWRQRDPNMIRQPAADGYAGHFRVMTAKNGKQFGWGMIDYCPAVFIRDGDVFKPFAAAIRIDFGQFGGGMTYPAMKSIYEKTKAGMFLWQDANDDQIVQENELVVGSGPSFNWIDADLNAWNDCGTRFAPVGFKADGRPIYDFGKAKQHPFKLSNGNGTSLTFDDAEQAVYTCNPGTDPGFARWTRDGKLVWAYRDIPVWSSALGLPSVKPGLLHGLTMPLGVAGGFTGAATYFNPYHIFTTDGIYVAMLTRDGRDGKGFGADLIASETHQGQLVKPKGMDRYFLLAGAADGRITEVLGLNTVKRLAGGSYVHTQAMADQATAARQAYDQAIAKSRSLDIVRGKPALAKAPTVGKRIEGGRGFTAQAAYDEKNLYLGYDVTTPAPLLSAATDPRLLFKSGNCIDLQIATDAGADAARKTPAPGDVRLLVTLQNGKPLAVIYRPKVKDFTGQAFVFTSPANKESFDAIDTTDQVGVEYVKTPTGFTAVVTVPLKLLGLELKPGRRLSLDLGYIFGNEPGTLTTARAYWCNNGFSANVLYDVPNESKLEPALWGAAVVE